MNKRNTRADIIRIASNHMHLYGYNTSRIDAILMEAKVPKGSFYHFFKSKEDLGMAVIDVFAEGLELRLKKFLSDPEVAPLIRIRNFFEDGLARLTQNECTKGCLLGNFGQEMADVNERFRYRLDEIFSMWTKRFADCLREAQTAGALSAKLDPEAMAYFMLSGYEGSILSAKVMKSPRPMKAFITVLFSSVIHN